MQILKGFLVCAVVCGVSFIALAQSDTPEQAQMREALRNKMAELNAQGAVKETPTTKSAAPKPTKTKPVFAPVPATRQTPAMVAPAPVRATAKPSSVAYPEPTLNTMPSDEAARLRQALEEKLNQLNAQKTTGQPAPTKAAPMWVPSKTTASTPSPSYVPLRPPPPAVSSSKEAQLQALLQKYKADAITPEQYHEARAKILAEP